MFFMDTLCLCFLSTPGVRLHPVYEHLVLICQMLPVNLVFVFQFCHVHLVLLCRIYPAHLVLIC